MGSNLVIKICLNGTRMIRKLICDIFISCNVGLFNMVQFKHKFQFCYIYFHIIFRQRCNGQCLVYSPCISSLVCPSNSNRVEVRLLSSSVITPNNLSSISYLKPVFSFPEPEIVKKNLHVVLTLKPKF